MLKWLWVKCSQLNRIENLLHQQLQLGDKLMAAIDDLTTSIQKEDVDIDKLIVVVKDFSDALKAAGTDPVKLQALQADVDAKVTAIEAALAATPDPGPSNPTP